MTDSTPSKPRPTIESGYPFDLPSADLTLRSADDVDFHVHGAILSIASPFFRDMLSLPPPRDDSGASDCGRSRPVVPVPEDSKILKMLLQLCYPINKQSLVELQEIVPVLNVALKYDMDWPVTLLTKDLLSLVPRRPLKTWAIACQTGLEDVACQAALEMLRSYCPPKGGKHVNGAATVLQQMVEKEGLGILHGISAANYFLLREFLLAENPKTVLTDFYPKTNIDTSDPSVVASKRHATTFLPRFALPDLILQCPSGTSHLAHQLILSFHSPVIEALISAAKSTRPFDASADDTQAPLEVEVDLHSDTVVSLLCMCYDSGPCAPSILSDLAPVILAADKYQMPLIQKAVKERWDELARLAPLDAYCIAVQYGLAPHAKVAARAVLEHPINGAYVRSMESASALSYHRLVEYYGSCAAAVRDAVADMTVEWSRVYNEVRSIGLGRLPKFPSEDTMETYIRDTVERGRDECPGKDFKEFTLVALLEQSGSEEGSLWPECTAKGCRALLAALSELSRKLPQVIADAISEVELGLD